MVPADLTAILWVSTTVGPTDSGLLLSRENHSSQTCCTRAPGHKEEATALNMMGGSNTIRRRQNQPAVYCAPVSN
jgi:hypothetical protein